MGNYVFCRNEPKSDTMLVIISGNLSVVIVLMYPHDESTGWHIEGEISEKNYISRQYETTIKVVSSRFTEQVRQRIQKQKALTYLS
jgi:hypothetical protein